MTVCKKCNGTGELRVPVEEHLGTVLYGKEQCDECGGTGEVQTNEEWFCNLPTEEKAGFFSHEMRCEFCPNQEQCDSLGANCKVLWEWWLKQPHRVKK
jgi:DnaJ-class molecular chaperone